MTKELQQLNNLLVIRNHLAKISESKLLELYKEYDFYLAFLNCIWLLIDNDSAFLLFDENFIDKVLSVIQIHRFDAKDDGVKQEVNDIIDYMNSVKSYSDDMKNVLKNNYLAYQEEQRNATFYSTEGLIDSLAYDAIVFSSLRNGDMDSIHYDEHFILSLNFLMNTCPELFQNKEIMDRALKRLEVARNHTKRLSPNKKLIKHTKTHLDDLRKKE